MNNYKFKTYSTLTKAEKKKFYEFCKSASLETDQPAAKNMWDDNWKTCDYTLPYILEYVHRFSSPKGEFFILFDKKEIVGCSGIYISDFDPNIAVAGVRTWINKQYRHQTLNRDYFLPIQKQWAIDKDLKIVLLTFNDYNRNIIKIFKRGRLGEQAGRTSSREPHHLFYLGLNEIEFPINVQYTKQWGIYERLDSSWDFDWTLIRFDNR